MDIEHKSIIHGYEGQKTLNNPSSNFTNDQVLGNDKLLWWIQDMPFDKYLCGFYFFALSHLFNIWIFPLNKYKKGFWMF